MQEIYDFIKECGCFFIATQDGDQARVRPFGAIEMFEDKIYIACGKLKNVSKQMAINPKVEIAAIASDNKTWIRLEAVVVEDDRDIARQHMSDAYPNLRENATKEEIENFQVFYLKDIVASNILMDGKEEVK
ncbi:MAG: pyridoxamine 5'-phosphate oxidase family protein [Clostridioides sp.]|jgi:uncharacterized pyridoxamine 5'-phosphate oxidase family protein|nr:pyridoxamine 5'-phosphate oxidase family protein [Clostridioides sp.]